MFSFIKTFITNKLITIDIYMHNKYSWNLLSIFGWIEFIYFIYGSIFFKGTAAGMASFIFVLFFYPITLIIFIVILLIENLTKISIKNENIVKSKKYKILRYIGLIVWFYYIIALLLCAILY